MTSARTGMRVRAQYTAPKDSAFPANAQAGPATANTTVASAGPITRPTLNCAELRLSALCSDSGGTSSAISATKPGSESVPAQPLRNASSAIQPTVRCPVKASPAKHVATSICAAVSTPMYARRSKRSASAPATGDSTNAGTNESATTVPVHAALPVCAVTVMPRATVDIQVPTLEMSAPVHKAPKPG